MVDDHNDRWSIQQKQLVASLAYSQKIRKGIGKELVTELIWHYYYGHFTF